MAAAALLAGCDVIEIRAVEESAETEAHALYGNEGGHASPAISVHPELLFTEAECDALTKPTCKTTVFDAEIQGCLFVSLPDGTACDDGLEESVDDACLEGSCHSLTMLKSACSGSGLIDECNSAVLNPATGFCAPLPVADGTPCPSTECHEKRTCNAGVCGGGKEKECSWKDTPCESFNCSTTGGCEPVPHSAGATPKKVNDHQWVVGDCEAEVCDGEGGIGMPLPAGTIMWSGPCAQLVCDGVSAWSKSEKFDESVECLDSKWWSGEECWLDTGHCNGEGACKRDVASQGTACPSGDSECTMGECDANGLCYAVPIAEGTACASHDRQCSTGECNALGACEPVPANEGASCNAVCANEAICSAGECQPSSEAMFCDPAKRLSDSTVLTASGTVTAIKPQSFSTTTLLEPFTAGGSWRGLSVDLFASTVPACGWDADGTYLCLEAMSGGNSWQEAAVQLPNGQGILQAEENAAMIAADGTLWVLGANWGARFGIGTSLLGAMTPTVKTLTQVGTDTDWKEIALTLYTACGIRDDGTLWCSGNVGQYPQGSPCEGWAEFQQLGTDTWTRIWSRNWWYVAQRSDGAVFVWDAWKSGCYDPALTQAAASIWPGPIMGEASLLSTQDTVKSVHVGGAITLVYADGTMWGWANGTGDAWALAVGGALGLPLPDGSQPIVNRQIGNQGDWIAVGGAYVPVSDKYDRPRTFAMKSDGTLWEWGGEDRRWYAYITPSPGVLNINELRAIPRRLW